MGNAVCVQVWNKISQQQQTTTKMVLTDGQLTGASLNVISRFYLSPHLNVLLLPSTPVPYCVLNFL